MMKKCLSLLLALCLGLLAGCGSAPSVDYPELPAVDTGALELESASNSSLKVSFLKADWVAEPNTDPLSVYYREPRSPRPMTAPSASPTRTTWWTASPPRDPS